MNITEIDLKVPECFSPNLVTKMITNEYRILPQKIRELNDIIILAIIQLLSCAISVGKSDLKFQRFILILMMRNIKSISCVRYRL